MSDERPTGGSDPASGTTLTGEDSLLTGPSEWTAPRQRTAPETAGQSAPHEVVSVDHRDPTPVFDNTEFQLLRERLFGSAAISSFPVSLRDDNGSDDDANDVLSVPPQLPFPIQVEPPPEYVDPAPQAMDTPETGEPLLQAIDWATVSPTYEPTTDEREVRGWVLTVVALVVVLAGIGGWLAFGNNGPRIANPSSLPNPTGAPAAAIGSTGLTSEASVTPRLMVVVSEHVVLAEPIGSAIVTIPFRTDTAATEMYDPAVNDLEILVGGVPLDGVNPSIAMGGSITVYFPTDVREFTLTYRASGAVNLSKPSKDGRGLALINVITVTGTEGLPSTITVNGARILSLGCVPPGQPIDDCGTDDNSSWVYTGVVGDSVLAQVDLPPTD